jgi:hypothetical protein
MALVQRVLEPAFGSDTFTQLFEALFGRLTSKEQN